MTKQDLCQIKYIVNEIEYLRQQIEKAEYAIMPGITSDIVRGSASTFPFTERTFKVSGIDWSGYDGKITRLKIKYKKRISELLEKVEEATEYIAAIPDSETRIVLQARYIEGRTWEEVEEDTGINIRTAHRILKRWFQKD